MVLFLCFPSCLNTNQSSLVSCVFLRHYPNLLSIVLPHFHKSFERLFRMTGFSKRLRKTGCRANIATCPILYRVASFSFTGLSEFSLYFLYILECYRYFLLISSRHMAKTQRTANHNDFSSHLQLSRFPIDLLRSSTTRRSLRYMDECVSCLHSTIELHGSQGNNAGELGLEPRT